MSVLETTDVDHVPRHVPVRCGRREEGEQGRPGEEICPLEAARRIMSWTIPDYHTTIPVAYLHPETRLGLHLLNISQ